MAKGKKTGGRLRGTPNKVTAQMRKRIAEVIDAIDVQKELKSLTANERVKLWTSLIEFLVPKYERSNPTIQAEIDDLKSELQKLKQLKTDEITSQNGNRDAES